MAKSSTSMAINDYVFKYDLDVKELRLSQSESQMILSDDAAVALGDFLFEVLTAQGRPPRILPLKITDVEVKANID